MTTKKQAGFIKQACHEIAGSHVCKMSVVSTTVHFNHAKPSCNLSLDFQCRNIQYLNQLDLIAYLTWHTVA